MRLEIEYLTPAELQPYANNAKLHPDKQVQEIANSIKEFDFSDPIGIWGDNEVVEGHGRLLAALKLGLEEVPVIRLDHLTDEQRRAYMMAHNQTTMTSGWDAEKLLKELSKQTIDMSLFGFDVSALAPAPDIEDDEYDGDGPSVPVVQRGQVWLLGGHRLMCGDSSSKEDLARLMSGDIGNLVFTDPPYGVSIGDKNKMLDEVGGGSGRIKTNIENDTLSTDELYDLLLAAFLNLREVCADDCSYYVTSPQGGEIGLMMMMMRDAGLAVRHNLIWEKSSATFSMGRLDYDYKHEPIFYTWTKKHNFYGKGNCKNTVWQFPKPRKCDLHPTMKPVELVAECLLNSSVEGDVVVDIFGGSGTTMIACEQLGRKCRMMELDPHYCDVIIDRWETLTGKRAELTCDS